MVVDLQGFFTPDFHPKEIAIFDGYRSAHFLIKSPKPLFAITDADIMRQIRFIQANVHGIYYESGYIPYESTSALLYSNLVEADVIYVKGKEKLDYLQKIFSEKGEYRCPEIRNVEGAWGCPKLSKDYPACLSHTVMGPNQKTRCALNNCRTLYSWLTDLFPCTR